MRIPSGVSILVLVDGALEGEIRDIIKSSTQVSILVLVDGALEETTCPPLLFRHRFQSLFSWMVRSKIQGRLFTWSRTSFNPCSRGWCARSLEVRRVIPLYSCFNPCSRGWCARSNARELKRVNTYGFQSLFSWMVRSKRVGSGPGRQQL